MIKCQIPQTPLIPAQIVRKTAESQLPEESRTKTKNQATIVHFQVNDCIVQHLNQRKLNKNDEIVD